MGNSSNSLNSYKKLNSSFDLIKTPARYDEDLYFVSNKNNSDDSLSYLLQINSNRRNEEFNPAFFSRQNFVENLPFQNIPNEERTIVGTTQIPENPENNKYSLGRNPIYILNEDSDKNFNENSLDGLSFRTIQSNSNNRNSNINQDYPHIQNIGNAPNEPRTSPTVIQIPVNPENNNNLLNISLTSINSSQSINNSDENFNENISDDNSLSSIILIVIIEIPILIKPIFPIKILEIFLMSQGLLQHKLAIFSRLKNFWIEREKEIKMIQIRQKCMINTKRKIF